MIFSKKIRQSRCENLANRSIEPTRLPHCLTCRTTPTLHRGKSQPSPKNNNLFALLWATAHHKHYWRQQTNWSVLPHAQDWNPANSRVARLPPVSPQEGFAKCVPPVFTKYIQVLQCPLWAKTPISVKDSHTHAHLSISPHLARMHAIEL